MKRHQRHLRFMYRSSPSKPPGAVLLDIIRESEQRNARLCLSGMLVHSDCAYAQIIEGPSAAVLVLRAMLRRDPRHLILWEHVSVPRYRTISVALPMGYADAHEMHVADLVGPGGRYLTERPPDALFQWFVQAVAAKYPSALLAAHDTAMSGAAQAAPPEYA